MRTTRHTTLPISDYGQLRRRAEQCRAEELARLVALARAAFGRWRARTTARRAARTALGRTPRTA